MIWVLKAQHQLRIKVLSGIIRGMVYMHGRKPEPIIHRDLSTNNILVADDCSARIADFGLSRIKESDYDMTGRVGCIPWMAPEVFKCCPYNEKADVFSFGMVLYEIFTGQLPCQNMAPEQFVTLITYENYRPPLRSPSIKNEIPSAWCDIITACWHSDPKTRPSFEDLNLLLTTNIITEVPRPALAVGTSSATKDESTGYCN